MRPPQAAVINVTVSALNRQLEKVISLTKAELPKEGILFHTQFPSLGFFINKKVGF